MKDNTIRFTLITLLVMGVSFGILNWMTWLYADDYSYAFVFCAEGGIDVSQPISIGNLCESSWNHYFMKIGRTIVHGLDQLFLCAHNKHVFDVCNTLVFMAFVYMLQLTSDRRNWTYTLFAVAVIFLLSRSFGQVYLWQTGSLNYMWTGLANLLFLWLFHRKRSAHCSISCVLLMLVALVVGWMQETVSVGMAAMLVVMVLMEWRNTHQCPVVWVLMTAGYVVGTLFIIFSPGTLLRAEASGTTVTYMLSHLGFGIINVLLNLRIFWLLVVVVAILKCCHRLSFRGFLRENRLWLLAIVAEGLFLVPLGRVVEPRALFGVELFALILLLRVVTLSPRVLGTISTIALAVGYTMAFKAVWNNHQLSKDFYEQVERSDDGVVFFDIPYYRGRTRHYIGSRIDLDHHRTAYNQECAAYYGKRGLLVLPEHYRDDLYYSTRFIHAMNECEPGKYGANDITFFVIPLPAGQLPLSTPTREYVSFPSGNYLLEDIAPLVNDGNAQIRVGCRRYRKL